MVAAEPPAALQLVLGAARSGKSRWAEHLAASSGLEVVYVATGPGRPGDGAWQQRLQRHRERRPSSWQTREISDPFALLAGLSSLSQQQLALVDSLGSWVAGALDLDAPAWHGLCEQLLAGLDQLTCPLVLVSEQTGWGVVPPTAIGGLFRDRLGMIERLLVAQAHTTWLVVAGRALNLTALGHPVPAD